MFMNRSCFDQYLGHELKPNKVNEKAIGDVSGIWIRPLCAQLEIISSSKLVETVCNISMSVENKEADFCNAL